MRLCPPTAPGKVDAISLAISSLELLDAVEGARREHVPDQASIEQSHPHARGGFCSAAQVPSLFSKDKAEIPVVYPNVTYSASQA